MAPSSTQRSPSTASSSDARAAGAATVRSPPCSAKTAASPSLASMMPLKNTTSRERMTSRRTISPSPTQGVTGTRLDKRILDLDDLGLRGAAPLDVLLHVLDELLDVRLERRARSDPEGHEQIVGVAGIVGHVRRQRVEEGARALRDQIGRAHV